MDAMHIVIGAVFFVIVIVIGICASEKKVTVQFKNPETGNILYSGKGNSVASALLDGFDKMYRNLSTNSREETLENRLATMKQAMEDNRHYLKKRDVEVCKEYIQKVQSLLTQKEQERKQLEEEKRRVRQENTAIQRSQQCERTKALTERQRYITEQRRMLSASMRYDVLRRDKFRCVLCGAAAKDGVQLHVDHIRPLSKGGKTEMSNLRTLCDRCNLGKGAKIE